MERLYQVHKTNPLQESQLAHTHATRRVNKVVRRAKRNKGTNAAGMAKHKPETFYAYLNLKVHSYTNGYGTPGARQYNTYICKANL